MGMSTHANGPYISRRQMKNAKFRQTKDNLVIVLKALYENDILQLKHGHAPQCAK